MSVIFQLFGTDDLKKIPQERLQAFEEAVRVSMNESPNVLGKVKERADKVFKQLMGPDEDIIPHRVAAVPASEEYKVMLYVLFDRADIAKLSDSQKEILEWAIICEVTHSEAALEAIKLEIDPKFQELSGEPPIGSDRQALYAHIRRP